MFIPGAVEGYNLQVQNQNVMWSIKNEKIYENYVNSINTLFPEEHYESLFTDATYFMQNVVGKPIYKQDHLILST